MTRAPLTPRCEFQLSESEGAGPAQPPAPRPQPLATMLSRLLKEHQAKQNERKELQGELNIRSAVFSPAAA